MPDTNSHDKLNQIFEHHYFSGHKRLKKDNVRFIHYTSAENAFKIINGREIWLRSPITMNDHSEFTYGVDCLKTAFSSKIGSEIINIFNELCKNKQNFSEHTTNFLENIYIQKRVSYSMCFTEFDGKGDGLLSMWRAYGGKNAVALVFNREHFFHPGVDRIGILPVTYLNESEITLLLKDFLSKIKANIELLSKLDLFFLNYYFYNKFYNLATHNKHPAFKEEKEWRITFKAEEHNFKDLSPQVINGVPQLVKKYSLHQEFNGNVMHDISSLVEKIIIGPCEFPINTAQAFLNLLREKEVPNAEAKIHLTNIPLRI